MDTYDPATVPDILFKALFLCRVCEISARAKKENHVIFFDRSSPEVIQFVTDDEVESSLLGEEGSQELFITGRVVSPATHIKNPEFFMMIGRDRRDAGEKQQDGGKVAEDFGHFS